MTLSPRLPFLLALLGAAAAVPTAATAAPTVAERPHSRVVTYDRGQVRVQQLEATTARANGRLQVRLGVTLRNRTGGALTRYVRVGRCTDGAGPVLRCPATTTFAITLDAGQTRAITRAVELRQPAPGIDAFEVTIGAARRFDGRIFHGDAEMLLKGGAWRGSGAHHAFGVRFPAGDDRATRLSLDVPEVAPGKAYIFAKWEGAAAPQAPTTIARCDGDDCTARPLLPQRMRSSAGVFAHRFDFAAQGAPAIRLAAASTDGAPLLEATLPWPARP